MIDGQRVELQDWRGIAEDLAYSDKDITLLDQHFTGSNTLLNDLKAIREDLTTNWCKLKDHEKSSMVRICRGKVQYKTYQGKYIKPHVKIRSSKDKHINCYLVFGKAIYLHKAAAYAIAKERGYKGFYSDFDLVSHHRLIGESATLAGNQLDKLVLMTVKDHLRLHAILKNISKNIKHGSLQTVLL